MRNEIKSKKGDKIDRELRLQKAVNILNTIDRDKKPTKNDIKKKLTGSLCKELESLFIRNPDEISFKSHNIEKQVLELLKHTFCKYPVPEFMLHHFPYVIFPAPIRFTSKIVVPLEIKTRHEDDNSGIYQEMFQIITTGGSLRKYLKGTLTAKECAIFLTLKNNKTIGYNIWLSRLIASDVPKKLYDKVINRFLNNYNSIFYQFDDQSLFRFIKKYHSELMQDDIDSNDIIEILDYIQYEMRRNDKYTLNGRTYESIRRASNEWHEAEALRKEAASNLSWPAIEEESRVITINDVDYKFIELLNSRALFIEGQTQRHCVGSYAYRCNNGQCSIFSMRYPGGRITIEVSHGRIMQTKGKRNTKPDSHEKAAIKKWAEGRYNITKECL